ncbi:LamG-like jellyroll fold domain-containing protein [Rubritalea tangerina]|uniref:LamG-like jellyroll fold domain-containing protein n=1 Tax=Rubritalea tangerina TaxID=430798 RepID=A0ABW4ZAT7_9BACT
MKKEAFDELVQLVMEGQASQQQVAMFEAQILNDPEAMRRYQAWVSLESGLVHRSEIVSSTPQGVVPIEKLLFAQRKRALRVAALAAAALILVSLLVLRVVTLEFSSPSGALAFSPGAKWSVSHASTDAEEGVALEIGSRLVLEEGVVEVQFSNGVQSVISAPADLRYVEKDRVAMVSGNAWFEVPRKAIGFTVTTGELEVVDLGTEFGMTVDPEEFDEVHVFTGKVRARVLRNRRVSQTLEAGEARRLTLLGELEEIRVRDSQYLTELPKTIPSVHFAFENGKVLEGVATLPTRDPLVAHAEVRHSGESFEITRGHFGGAVKGIGNGYIQTNWPGILGDNPRTMSYWIRLQEGEHHYHSIAGWGTRKLTGTNSGFYSYLACPDKGTVSGLSFGQVWAEGTQALADGQWHHVTYTYSGEVNDDGLPDLKLYVDGKRDELHWFGGGERPEYFSPIHTGGEAEKREDLWFFGPIHEDWEQFDIAVHRELDELYVFPKVLSEREVQSLYLRNEARQ